MEVSRFTVDKEKALSKLKLLQGAEMFGELCSFNLGNPCFSSLFFYGFNWMWKRFRWGRAEEVSLKNKQLEGGWGGGRSASPQMHSQNMLRDSPAVHRILGALGS